MTTGCLTFHEVVFFYEAAAAPVFDGLSVRFPVGWTGVIGPNGSGKTTLLRLACGQLAPLRGEIISPDRVIYCPQRTDEPPGLLEAFVATTDPPACVLRGQLAIGPDWPGRWDTLSHGERKRAQIGVALWCRPRVLAIDEPTNHIDLIARKLLAHAMRRFGGIGLLVCHDRDLLDTLCGQCLFVEPPGATIRPGGYTKAVALAEADEQRARELRTQAKREHDRLRREQADRERDAARSHKLRSKRGLKPKDHDARFRRNIARGGSARGKAKDGQAGHVLRQIQGRVEQAEDKLAGIRVKRQRRLGIDMRGSRSQRDFLFRLPGGSLPLGRDRRLVFPDLSMVPADRVALIGPNGGGKSTLVRHIVARLDLPAEKVVYVAQEIDRWKAREVIAAVRRLPKGRLGEVMSVIACLGSEPQRLMETEQPSPGELRKIILALGMAHRPHLIIMDEPTNHLDLPSIECLENALNDCPSALLLVSHDLRFLRSLTRTRWEIAVAEDEPAGTQMRLRTGR